jgi:putative Holliday junction resolvase
MLMRVLGIDPGRRRIGLAISDSSATIARPLTTLTIGAGDALEQVLREVARLSDDEDGLHAIVVGLPTRLDGRENEATAHARAFVEALRLKTILPVYCEDERLTSREADSRLAERERDWRKRKAKLDAAAAAVTLQDYLDRQRQGER